MIRTALKASAIATAIAGATFMASPANASVHNHGQANHDTVNVYVIGGYGVTCASVALSGQSGDNCNHNNVWNDRDLNAIGNY